MSSIIGFLIFIAILVNIIAVLAFLYFLVDRRVCLQDAYRLLRLLREVEPRTYRYIVGWSPLAYFFIPQHLIEFLLDFELEEHDAIKQQKNRCRCWFTYYNTLSDYILRIFKIALIIPSILLVLAWILFKQSSLVP